MQWKKILIGCGAALAVVILFSVGLGVLVLVATSA